MKPVGVSRLRRGLCMLACAAAWSGTALAQDAVPAAAWAQAPQPGQAEWSAAGLKAADQLAASMQTDTFLVVQRGTVVHGYGDITKPHSLYSVRKSILSVLIGMQVDRGRIDLGETLAALQIDDVDGLTDQEKTATVRQLMQSKSGVYHGAAYEADAAKALRPARGSHAPGSFWYYNNWDFNTLGAIYQLRAGKSVFEGLRDDLAQPLQFEDFKFERDTQFFTERVSRYPAYVMHLSARDLARVGLLMARGGRWGDQQLVSTRWVAESTAAHTAVMSGWHGYAAMWWVPRRAWPFWTRNPGEVFYAWGNFGQFLFVDRRRDLVIVHLADRRRFFSKDVTDESISPLLERILAAAPSP